MFFHEWETCFNKICTSNQAFIRRFGLQKNLQICRFHVMKMLKLTCLICTNSQTQRAHSDSKYSFSMYKASFYCIIERHEYTMRVES